MRNSTLYIYAFRIPSRGSLQALALLAKLKSEAFRQGRFGVKFKHLPEVQYPFHDRTIAVTQCGRICVDTKKINLSQVFAGQNVGIKEEEDNIWLVSFMQYDIGYFDLEACRVEPVQNPFGPKVLTMSPV